MEKSGLRVTTAGKTLLDLASIVPGDLLEECVEQALRLRLTSLDRLHSVLERSRGRGKRGAAGLGRVLGLHGTGAPTESLLETRVLQVLRSGGLPRPVRQFVVTTPTGKRRLDLAYPCVRLAIECDGRIYHSEPSAWKNDLARHNELTALEWAILHVTWEDAQDRPSQVVQMVKDSETIPRSSTSSELDARSPSR